MKYMFVAIETVEDFSSRTGPHSKAYWAGWQAYTRALREAGVLVSGEALKEPETATTVRLRGGEQVVEDGPFAESREQLGGFFVIDVDSLDEAMVWAARMPCAGTGAVEVRPVLSMP